MNKLFSKIVTLSVGLAMAVGVGVALGQRGVQRVDAAEQHAKYTITSKTAVSKSGIAPDGSTATYSQTYGTVSQMTNGNSMTLKLSGYNGYKVTKVVLSMHSNAKAGAGALNVRVGTADQLSGSGATTIFTMESALFNTSAWNGAWSQDWVDIEKEMTTEKNIEENEIVEFKINATSNSLFCESFDVYYVPAVVVDIESITAVNLEKTSVPANYGKTIDVTATYTTAEANEPFEWTSSDTSVATIAEASAYGAATITLKGVEGTTTIKAAAANHKDTVFATATLTVTEAVVKHVYDVTFAGNGETDSSTELTTSNIGSSLLGDGSALTVSELSKVYNGSGKTLKFSNSSVNGSITISKVGGGDGDNIKMVIFEAKRYSDKTCSLAVQVGESAEQSTDALPADFKYYSFEFETAAKSITISSTERSYIRNLVLIVDGNTAELGAYNCAVELLNATAEGCSEKSESKLSTAWTALSTGYAEAKTEYAGMDDFIKAAAPKEDGDVVEKAIARYKYIIEKYGFEDFAGRGYLKSVLFTPAFSFGNNAGYVIIIGIVTMSALAFGVFFLISKKKHQ